MGFLAIFIPLCFVFFFLVMSRFHLAFHHIENLKGRVKLLEDAANRIPVAAVKGLDDTEAFLVSSREQPLGVVSIKDIGRILK